MYAKDTATNVVKKEIDYLNKIIEKYPNDPWGYNNRGVAYNDLGNYDEAIVDFTKAIDLDPNDAQEYINRGSTYIQKQNFVQAIADLNKALELKPDNAHVYFKRAEANYFKKEYNKAFADVHEAKTLGYKLDKEDFEFFGELKKASGREK